MTETTAAIWQAPEIPSKWDIIPIHNSDRTAYKRCRRFWNWSSPARHNLSIRADVHGINVPMWFGTGVHYALEQFYTPGLRRDPVEAFQTWFDIQWKGGVVTAEWLDRVHDLKPRPRPDRTISDDWVDVRQGFPGDGENILWEVRGLEQILPDPDQYEFEELRSLGIAMMANYKRYAEINDGFEILVAEHDFSVPIWDLENEKILRWVDVREDSPNYSKTLEVHARGRMDGIWANPAGKLGIIDHKTAARIDDDYFRKLETDEQVTTYLWAAEIEAAYYNLPHAGEPLQEVIYNTLRKAAPTPPTVVRGGLFSTDRQKESPTYEMLMEFIRENQIDVESLSERHKEYISYVQEVGDEQFIIRKQVRRNRHQLVNAGKRIFLEAREMLSDPAVYPNISNDHNCLNCQFRPPCLCVEDGGDWQQLIADNYTATRDR